MQDFVVIFDKLCVWKLCVWNCTEAVRKVPEAATFPELHHTVQVQVILGNNDMIHGQAVHGMSTSREHSCSTQESRWSQICSPIAKHEGKGSDYQGHNEGPHCRSLVDVPKTSNQGNVDCFQAQALEHHAPALCLKGVQRKLYPDSYQVSQPVAATGRHV